MIWVKCLHKFKYSTPTPLVSSFTCKYWNAPLCLSFCTFRTYFFINLIDLSSFYCFLQNLKTFWIKNARFPCVIVNTAHHDCTEKTRCCQVTKTHVIDFDWSRAWICTVNEDNILSKGYHITGKVVSVLSLEGRYHAYFVTGERSERRTKYIVTRAIKLI